MSCIPSLPLDGIVKFNALANKQSDHLFRVTSVAHACLALISALATQSVRAVVRLVTGNPLDAGREVVGMIVQIVALPILGLGRMIVPGHMAKVEKKLLESFHRPKELLASRYPILDRVTLRVYGLMTFPVHLIQSTAEAASALLTLDSEEIKGFPFRLLGTNVKALVDTLASATLIKDLTDERMRKVFDSPTYCYSQNYFA